MSAVFVRGKTKLGFELEGKLMFERGWICIKEANEYGDFEFDCSKDFGDGACKYLETIRASVQAYVESSQ